MKNLVTTALLAGSFFLLGSSVASAQSRASKDPAAAAAAPQQTPEEAAREQQLHILEARAGNSSFGDGNGGAFRQLDKGNGAFAVRKFKAMPGQENKRGRGHQAPGIDPKGEPLVNRKHRKRLFFND